jgi:hypothetical protein
VQLVLELDDNSPCANYAQGVDDGKTYWDKFRAIDAFLDMVTKVLDTFAKQD